MNLILAKIKLLQLYEAFYILVGPIGILAAFLVVLAVLCLMPTKKGANFLFYIFILESLLCATGIDVPARIVTLTIFRYFLLFPVAFLGLMSLFHRDKKIGVIGVLLLIHVFLYVFTVVANSGYGAERFLGTVLMWFALVGFLSGRLTDIEKTKQFLSSWGLASWMVILATVGYALLLPGASFLGVRFRSIFARPNSMAIALFFVSIPIGYRSLIMARNKVRIIDISCLGIVLIMILMSGVRAAGFGIIPVLFVLLRGRSKAFMVIGFLLFFTVFIISWNIPHIHEVIQTRFLPEEGFEPSGRLDIWRSQWPIVFEKPLLGHGLGYIAREGFKGTHNTFLILVIEGGLINSIILVLAFLAGMIETFFRTRALQTGPDKRIGWLILASIIGIMFICTFESIGVGIGGGGIVVVWTLLQLSESLRPSERCYDDYHGDALYVSSAESIPYTEPGYQNGLIV